MSFLGGVVGSSGSSTGGGGGVAPIYKPGFWYGPARLAVTVTGLRLAKHVLFTPFVIFGAFTWKKIGFRTSNQVTVIVPVWLGVYADTGLWYPGKQLSAVKLTIPVRLGQTHSATLAGSASAWVVWLAMLFPTGPKTFKPFKAATGSSTPNPWFPRANATLSGGTATGTIASGYEDPATSVALPTPAPAGMTVLSSTAPSITLQHA